MKKMKLADKVYKELSNREILNDYRGIKSGKYYNIKIGRKTSLQYLKGEIKRRKEQGLMNKNAGSQPRQQPRAMNFMDLVRRM